MKKKIGIILLFAAAACAAFAAAFTHSGELGVNPFDRSFTFENLSFAVKDKTGSSFVIDRSMRRIVKLRPDETVIVYSLSDCVMNLEEPFRLFQSLFVVRHPSISIFD